MSILWFLLVVPALASVHDSKTVNLAVVDKDSAGSKECTAETCTSNRRPLPIVLQESDRYQIDSVVEETISEEKHFYGEKMKTNFTCDDKPYIPGFYADMETGCQVFHLCMKTSVDHFLCPIGTGFDQKYLVCSSDGKKYCRVSAPGYIMNLRVPETFPIISGIKAYDLNRERANLHYKQLKEYQSANPEMIDRDLIRILILLQFVEVSHFLPNLVTVEDPHYSEEGRYVDASPMFSDVLEEMLYKVFPLIPVNYSTDPQVPVETHASWKSFTTTSNLKAARSLESLWDPKSGPEEVPEEGDAPGRSTPGEGEKSQVFGSLKDPRRRALRVIKMILDVIANTSGKISPVSRQNIVTNYVNYLNKSSRFSGTEGKSEM